MPSLVHFFIRNILIGCIVAALFVALLLYLNVNGLTSMLIKDKMWPVAVFLLWFGNATVFGAVQVAYAVLTLPKDDPGGR